MKKISNKYIQYSLVLIAGLFLGWLFFHSPQEKIDTHNHKEESAKATIWTCSMHPQIRMDHPGKCPICGMDLIPLNQNEAPMDPDAIHLTREAAELANVMTSVVSKQKPVKEVRLYGKVQADERLLQSQVAHIPGRIEKLMVNFTGEAVRRGQTLALIFSPELVTAQQELLEAAKAKETQPEIYEAVKEKLHLWKLTENQINNIENSGTIQNNFEVVSNTSGIVTARRVNDGDHIAQGAVLYDIADLSKVWVLFDAYESDLPFLNEGNKISFTVQAIPGTTFTGNITFIDPVIDPVTRVSKVRVEINNQSNKLKPEMFATGIVNANLAQYKDKIIIPRSAVLWTGERSVVYVKQGQTDEPVFKIREIELGPMLGNSYVVLNGLDEGEEIVTQGTFSIDAAAQLEGKPSMMNPREEKASIEKENQNMPEANNDDFKMRLSTVFDQYIILKDAFVQSDAKKVQQAAAKVQRSLADVDMKQLSGNTHKQWMDISPKLINGIKQISTSDNIDAQRKAFSEFNNNFYKAVKTFGLTGKTVYYQFCPMANNNKGAYWLSKSEPIRNPYFGDDMLTCGENRETLKY
jgi:Cu(I)/Ag(I) efflux system membrane fusion protein